MATGIACLEGDWTDLRAGALALTGAEECLTRGSLAWRAGRLYVWELPLRKYDVAEVGQPDVPILCFRVEDEAEKAALVAKDASVFHATRHFEGSPIVLARFGRARLVELVETAWVVVASPHAVAVYFGPPPLIE